MSPSICGTMQRLGVERPPEADEVCLAAREDLGRLGGHPVPPTAKTGIETARFTAEKIGRFQTGSKGKRRAASHMPAAVRQAERRREAVVEIVRPSRPSGTGFALLPLE